MKDDDKHDDKHDAGRSSFDSLEHDVSSLSSGKVSHPLSWKKKARFWNEISHYKYPEP